MTFYNLMLYTYLAPSKVCHGVGVFALIDIPKDTCVLPSKPEKIKKVLWSELDSCLHSRIKSITCGDEEGFYIDCDLSEIGPKYYVNHSHSPNVAYNRVDGSYYAIKDIKKDEELLDYYFPGERDWPI